MKKVLVTGGAGFIGSHLVDKLIEKGEQVVVVDNLSTGRKENLNPKAIFYPADICSGKIDTIFKKEKPELVFHLAAHTSVIMSVQDPLKDAQTNILGSLNLLEKCRQFGVKKIIFASTGGALYGDARQIPTPEDYPLWPLSPYGIAKSAVEKYLYYYKKIFGLPFVSLRLANVYGPRQNPLGEAGVVAIFCYKLLKNEKPLINGQGEQTRDYVFFEDVVRAFLLAAQSDKTGFYNVGTGRETSVNKLFQILKKIIGSKQEALHGPAKPGELQRSCLDYSKIKKELGWQPKYNLERGLKETINWFQKG